jgi:formylglycine-generating enzyme required for sulfatase activity
LTTSQATLRFNGVSALYRYGISVSAGVYTTSLPNVAAGYLSWADLAAYLDWSGLRPLTDMEFEKTCRGNLPAVAGEYAWGTTTISGATGISNSGLVNEIASNSGANAAYNNVAGVAGPMRVGCFAGATTTRAQAGATYYGAMEMSGNLWERAINLSSTDGKAFTGNHGDGNLATTGDHNVSSWPSSTSTNGVRLKGGSFSNASNFLNISDRTDFGDAANRSFNAGGRGGRTAP